MTQLARNSRQTNCKQCGECCINGGPALHTEDLELVKNGVLPLDKLVTIRKGELVHNPVKGGVLPATTELIKITGKGRSWSCFYFNESLKNCSFYENRPYSCRVLKCWEPEESIGLIEQGTISRFDIMADDDPLVELVRNHENNCPNPDFTQIQIGELDESMKVGIEQRVQDDLAIRTRAVKIHDLSLAQELFYFGRPMFQLLSPLGVKIVQHPSGIRLNW